jgi:hypothetical protein
MRSMPLMLSRVGKVYSVVRTVLQSDGTFSRLLMVILLGRSLSYVRVLTLGRVDEEGPCFLSFLQ